MDKRMTKALGGCLLAVLLFMLPGCEKDAHFKEYVYPVPVVNEIYPEAGYIGSQVAILGTNFGDRLEPLKVFFGGVEVTNIISCKNDRIIVEVPEKAQSGKIQLQVWTHTLETEGEYTVIPTPVINSITSNNAGGTIFAVGGDEVTISGSAFGTDPSEVTVTINGKNAEILSLMDTEIKVKTPENYGSGLVVIDVNGYVVEGTALIDPSTKGDVTSLFLRNSRQPFQRSDSGDGEWGTAMYWLTNANFAGSSLQVTDDQPDGLLTMMGANNKWNGALYQVTTLPEGEYEITVEVAETMKTSGRYGAQFGVAAAEGAFPNLAEKNKVWVFEDMTTILCNANLATSGGAATAQTHVCHMTLTGTTTVTIGFATMLANNNYVKVSGITIVRK